MTTFSLDMITAAAQAASYEAPASKARARDVTPVEPKEPIFTIGTYAGGSGRARFNSAMRVTLEGHNFGKYLKLGVAAMGENLIVFLKFTNEAPASKVEEKITCTVVNETTTPFFNLVERTSQIIDAERRSTRSNPSHIPALEAMQQLYGDYVFGGPVEGVTPEPGKVYTLPAGNDNDAFVIIPRRPLTDENIVKWTAADNEVLEARRRSSKAQSILRVVCTLPDAERDALVADKCGNDAELLALTTTLLAGRRERDQYKATVNEMLSRITDFDQLEAECDNKDLLKIAKAAFLKNKNPVNVDVTTITAELEEVDAAEAAE
jgi:hypothetical protein